MTATTSVVALHRVIFTDLSGAQVEVLPGSGAFALPSQQVDELVALGSIRLASPLDLDGDGEPGGSIDELDQMKVDELKVLAERETVDLKGITKHADIIAAIRAGRENLLA